MENKPKMILEIDEYNKLLNGSKKDSEMAVCLLSFLSKCMVFGSNDLMYKLQDLMTECGYTVKYDGLYGQVVFGEGDKIILINKDREVTDAEV